MFLQGMIEENAPMIGVLARFNRPGESGNELSFCPGVVGMVRLGID